ncbi:hypothetical protein ISS22_01135 [candidate division KSB1 bacterium]|nr:hypothetical protein [candidate division KSB1 bacterium]
MIAGILNRDREKVISNEEIYSLFDLQEVQKDQIKIAANRNFAAAIVDEAFENISEVWQNEKNVVAFSGNVFNRNEITGLSDTGRPFTQILADQFTDKKTALFNELNGSYSLSIWNSELQQLVLTGDHFGIEPLYYFWDEEKLIFASSIKAILRHPDAKAEIDFEALHTYLLFNYNPRQETLIAGIKRLCPGYYLKFEKNNLTTEQYWYLSFLPGKEKTENQYIEELLPLLKKSIEMRIPDSETHGAFLSGGMDSSSIVGLMSPMVKGKIHTFSFRCKGKSFDESHYANIVSCRYNTEHHLVEYSPQEVLSIGEIVEYMDEPFCDIGIEVASYILGRAAQDKINYVLTGDGGDELFAGHPVYQADEVARKFSKIPRPLQKMMTSAFSLFPDTDKKKSFAVKAQRFAYSYGFSEKLFSNRWRIYYNEPELLALFRPEYSGNVKETNPLKDIMAIYDEADGNDFLSKTLYGDYFTVVNFYLRRMQLLRKFGIEGRIPMFDPRLVEFAAKIPSHLKLRGSETKYILHKTMAGILPGEIVFRKDKLGHSVPFKNWLRDVPEIRNFIMDVLSESTIKRRGYFDNNFVQRLLTDHFSRKKNNSHRLWALLVLELWMQKNIA